MNDAPRAPVPGWLGSIVTITTQVGFPVVIAGVLLWFLLTRFQANMDAITERMAANTEVAASFVEQQHVALAELQKQTAELQQQTMTLKAMLERKRAGE